MSAASEDSERKEVSRAIHKALDRCSSLFQLESEELKGKLAETLYDRSIDMLSALHKEKPNPMDRTLETVVVATFIGLIISSTASGFALGEYVDNLCDELKKIRPFRSN